MFNLFSLVSFSLSFLKLFKQDMNIVCEGNLMVKGMFWFVQAPSEETVVYMPMRMYLRPHSKSSCWNVKFVEFNYEIVLFLILILYYRYEACISTGGCG